MLNKLKLDVLLVEAADLKVRTLQVEAAIARILNSPEYNTFDTLEDACATLENALGNMAFEACEGAGNFGMDEYTQEFIVDGVHYIAKMTFEYNRHDKTYYYIDGSEFSYARKDN